ncbi:protein DEK-like, partial [Stegodyphus dumicola]|uniref:protein DEK-like n=1 Tax=Stegodyphus dumicola TaxID=202533 RepID=UPI0015B16FDF
LREIIPEIVISEIRNISSDKEATAPTSNAAVSCSTVTITEEEQPEIEIVKASLSTSIEITPIPQDNVKVEHPPETDEPLSKVKKEVTIIPARVSYFGSDDEDDQPLSKMIGHPNDDQLRVLVTKIVKESKLEEITMKHVIRKVFETYPNFDLGYRKEFIKSIVRQILSQMDDQSCSVSTTVITI